jgi:hypothetical protein
MAIYLLRLNMTKYRLTTKKILRWGILSFLAVLISSQAYSSVEASASKRLIREVQNQIRVAQPGQVVYYSYLIFNRMPPHDLEPGDPYHRAYEDVWSSNQIQKTWIEIGVDGKIARSRTKLFNDAGLLLQDLMFDGIMETGYFPIEGLAYKSPMERSVYRDEQATLFEMFLGNAESSPRAAKAADGRPVVSIYSTAKLFQDSEMDIDLALLSFERPFIADLKPISVANRIDFEPLTHVPIGEGVVVMDQTGTEQLVSYQKLLEKKIVAIESIQEEMVFTQAIPEQAFAQSVDFSEHIRTVIGLDNIMKEIDYPIYHLIEPNEQLKLVAASLAIPNADYSPLGYMQGISLVSSQGPGVNSVYANADNTSSVTIIQGRKVEMQVVLKQTTPDWIHSEKINLSLGQYQTTGWSMFPADPERKYYVIETEDTILYVDSFGLSTEQLSSFLSKFAPLGATQPAFSIFLPLIQQ